ncbi:UDP-N-acetylmuramoyl-L-alanyl-D-glutamate--2,6-diaminopimelate ligase [Marinomonas sp. 15G1-11]|uniref:UDP-N-acetylmuramoyl-L-alanyl-D-glutamate--2,6-diaminopimelate ligase n=1 Tax=Marinomonas phaeophyticola TaxID=3004091 RepID=A0ABT4JYF1_9GAMM|nr:UDP-N-acetylmuramoyl-L-alanyl-D-glutamate--2,6-diaminopimelate ligase [Marinomonas sp. 15G1-11]MCZ2723092.1 UDP-N-acetylmuramoyl-L-alanyl-D-glutamate--2,6-diaminopimelate ligase [Marinomonas sp. 15G1-11]
MFTLSELFESSLLSVPQNLQDIMISDVQTDSRKVTSSSLFFALPGIASQGWDYLPAVAAKGCRVAVVPQDLLSYLKDSLSNDSIVLIPSKDVIRSLSKCLKYKFCQYPEYLIAVTGTNGKSSISYYIAQLMEKLDFSSGLIGTFGTGPLNKLVEAAQTTPDQLSLHTMLGDFSSIGLQCVAFEASSHALDQRRIDGVPFKCAVFSNLSRDHLDYHGSMACYAKAKRKLFYYPELERVVLNYDDDYFRFMSEGVTAPIFSYSIKDSAADFFASDLSYRADGVAFRLHFPKGSREVLLPLLGEFNVSNALAAVSALWDFVADKARLLDSLELLCGAPGRMQKLNVKNTPLVVVDYAHTPDALSYALAALKVHVGGRVICVFGCGGDRDKGKRPLMTIAALGAADFVWLTSDNPRTENPLDILSDAMEGVSTELYEGRLFQSVDRHQAIEAAINYARPEDVVLIAGKGHETYQDVMGTKHFFDDVLEAQKALVQYAN